MAEDPRGPVPEADPDQAWQDALAAGLVGRSKVPLNCELRPPMLGGEVTPVGRFFRRNHFPLPALDPASWRLAVGGLVGEQLSLDLAELRALPAVSVTVTLECAGNGRTGFSPAVPGESWELGAVSTACWTGARLADVLDRARIRPGAREVVFRGADGGPLPEVPGPVRFERSLPLADALRSGALLAYEMNGAPLPVAHGFPVRLVVPGWYAVAAVKWLTEIEVIDEPFRGFFQDTHYVYEWRRDGRREREPVRVQRVRAMIVAPAAGQRVSGGELAISGVAWSGAARVTHVEVAVDAAGTVATGDSAGDSAGDSTRDCTGDAAAIGAATGTAGTGTAGTGTAGTGTWRPAELAGPVSRFGWQRWQLRVRGVPAGRARVRARAADAAGNNQLATPEWNALGYGGNFVHEVTVTVG
jgi:DMSO/TMAO reductase YedYZ molybdopterin-dependent catalytic subunit